MYVRQATADDLNSIYTLACQYGQKKLDTRLFKALYSAVLRDRQRSILCAVYGETVVGYADMRIEIIVSRCEIAAVINEFFVAAPYRGSGIGTGLLLHLANQAKTLGCLSMRITASRVDVKTHAFLEKCGFEKTQHYFEKQL